MNDYSSLQETSFRIPISLKVEKDEMYYNFIKPARDDRSLTRIILDLLRAYYEDVEVRRLVDSRTAGEDVLKALNEEIDRITMEHSKSIAQVNALKFDTAMMSGGVYETDMQVHNINNAPPEQSPPLALPTSNETMDGILSILLQLANKSEGKESNNGSVPISEQIVALRQQQLGKPASETSFAIPDFDSVLNGGINLEDLDIYNIEETAEDLPKKPRTPIPEPIDDAMYAEPANEGNGVTQTPVRSDNVYNDLYVEPARSEPKVQATEVAQPEYDTIFDNDDAEAVTVQTSINVEQEIPVTVEPKSVGIPASFMKLSASLTKTSK